MDVFKTAQLVNIHLGYFCKKIYARELKKSPNLVTLLPIIGINKLELGWSDKLLKRKARQCKRRK